MKHGKRTQWDVTTKLPATQEPPRWAGKKARAGRLMSTSVLLASSYEFRNPSSGPSVHLDPGDRKFRSCGLEQDNKALRDSPTPWSFVNVMTLGYPLCSALLPLGLVLPVRLRRCPCGLSKAWFPGGDIGPHSAGLALPGQALGGAHLPHPLPSAWGLPQVNSTVWLSQEEPDMFFQSICFIFHLKRKTLIKISSH